MILKNIYTLYPGTKLKRGSLSILINFISFMFQIKIKLLNKIRYFCLIDSFCLFIELSALTLDQGRTHVFTEIAVFKFSGKERDESVIVKRNIDQNNVCKRGTNF